MKAAVHIGLPKTGTTTLQEHFFACHPEIAYLGQTNLWQNDDAKTVLRGLLLDGSVDPARRVVDRLAGGPKRLVISDEALSCGEFMQRAAKWPIVTDHGAVAERIGAVVGDPRIIIVLRRQDDWLESWYRQGLKTGKYVAKGFDAWLADELGETARDRLFGLLDYAKLVETYRDRFGSQRVDVHFFEAYKADFHTMAGRIARSLDVDPALAEELVRDRAANVSGDTYDGAPPLLKRLARSKTGRLAAAWLPAASSRLRSALRRERPYPSATAEDKAAIRERFRDSNRHLFDMLARPAEASLYCA